MVKNILMRGNIFPFFSPFRGNTYSLKEISCISCRQVEKIFSKKSCMGGNVLNIRLKKRGKITAIKDWRVLLLVFNFHLFAYFPC